MRGPRSDQHRIARFHFEAFLIEPDTQRRIGEYGRDRYGAPLFNPLRPK